MNEALFVSAFLVHASCVLAADEQLLHYVSDQVPANSYKYYSLEYEGIIKISLRSQTGDADLYISQTTSKPTYEQQQYCLQSTTCGDDIIFIPQSFKRPVTIGVYGHSSHAVSRYKLFAYHVTLGEDEYFDEQNPLNNLDTSQKAKSVKKSLVLTFLWTLLDQVIQVLF